MPWIDTRAVIAGVTDTESLRRHGSMGEQPCVPIGRDQPAFAWTEPERARAISVNRACPNPTSVRSVLIHKPFEPLARCQPVTGHERMIMGTGQLSNRLFPTFAPERGSSWMILERASTELLNKTGAPDRARTCDPQLRRLISSTWNSLFSWLFQPSFQFLPHFRCRSPIQLCPGVLRIPLSRLCSGMAEHASGCC